MRQDQRQQQIAAFTARRVPQSERDFIADCGLGKNARDVQIAIAVRQSVARSCGVEPAYIRAHDVFSGELYALWGEDSLDSIGFYIDLEARLEARLAVRLSERDSERIVPPFSKQQSVAQMVHNVIDVIANPAAPSSRPPPASTSPPSTADNT